MPTDLPLWAAVYKQIRGWIEVKMFDAIIADLSELFRFGQSRHPQLSPTMLDSRAPAKHAGK